MLKELSKQVVAYQAEMDLISQLKTDKSGEGSLIVDRLRDQGKKMTELSEELPEFESVWDQIFIRDTSVCQG